MAIKASGHLLVNIHLHAHHGSPIFQQSVQPKLPNMESTSTVEESTSSQHQDSQAIATVNSSILAYRFHYPRKLSKNITIHAEPTPIEGITQPSPPAAPPFHNYTEPTAPAIYFAAISEWNLKKPDIILHRRIDTNDSDDVTNADENTPVVGVIHTRYSRNFKLGIGDPCIDPNTVIWEDMINRSPFLGSSKYEFSIDIKEGENRARKKFEWKRTSAEENGVKGWRGRWSLGNYKLLDEDGNVVAVFLDRIWLQGIRAPGILGFKRLVSRELEVVVVLTCTGLVEKIRRARS